MKMTTWLTKEYLQGGLVDKWKTCSLCGYESGNVTPQWNYCPNCGAKVLKRKGAKNGKVFITE